MKAHRVVIAAVVCLVVAGAAGAFAQPRRTLTLWYPAGEITQSTLPLRDPTVFAPFEATSNVKIEMVAVDYDTMQQKIFAAAAAGNIADILFIDTSWLPGFLKEDLLEQVDPVKARRWLASVSPEIVTLSDYGGGTMWGYPQMGHDIYGLTWNKQQFRDAGLDPDRPPQTWDELRDYCRRLVKRDAAGNIVRVGYAIRHVGHPHGVVHKHLWAIWGAGADLIDNPNALRGGRVMFNNEAGRAALRLVLDMLQVDKCTSLNFPDPRAAFLSGIASMQISETVSIRARQPREAPGMPWTSGWGMWLPPARRAGDRPVTLLGAWLFSVPRAARHKDMAWRAVEWLNSEINDYRLASRFNLTPRYKSNWAKDPFKSDSYVQTLLKMAPYGRRLPINLGLNGIMDALGGAIQKAWHGEATVEAALAEAERLANKAIQDAMK
ncbi:MAG: extracellular solute-binding protein [Armatimonadota bacterium]|nr:extracellular solute-binding protein [Armatimonadota bacterium]MDR7437004.1 extracellular solute-binding protein [Armatimonadota bacterium]MDR7472925.1 extracellular solute-binding protein [Armatimonadota bacterium]MDR7507671.1 extracellular solute-binding protein [Armatimonadota bacterium]MDR7508890.1 extracellular solute-binding protein [Armatimonadota bacterium]